MKGFQINAVWGVWSVVMMMVVAAIALFAPQGMGPVHPPSAFTLLLFPLVLALIFFIMSRAAAAK